MSPGMRHAYPPFGGLWLQPAKTNFVGIAHQPRQQNAGLVVSVNPLAISVLFALLGPILGLALFAAIHLR